MRVEKVSNVTKNAKYEDRGSLESNLHALQGHLALLPRNADVRAGRPAPAALTGYTPRRTRTQATWGVPELALM